MSFLANCITQCLFDKLRSSGCPIKLAMVDKLIENECLSKTKQWASLIATNRSNAKYEPWEARLLKRMKMNASSSVQVKASVQATPTISVSDPPGFLVGNAPEKEMLISNSPLGDCGHVVRPSRRIASPGSV